VELQGFSCVPRQEIITQAIRAQHVFAV